MEQTKQRIIIKKMCKTKRNRKYLIKSFGWIEFIFYMILVTLSSCEGKEDSSLKLDKSSSYDHMIFNLALNTPYYNCSNCFIGSPNSYEGERKNILMKKSINSDDLNLNLHTWTSFGGEFPKSIVHVSDRTNFEFAFAFYDEYFYSLKPYEVKDKRFQIFLEQGLTFNRHLNYIIGQLEWNTPDKRDEVNNFITLLADSLLNLKEYKNDSNNLREKLNEELKDASTIGEDCAMVLRQNIERIVSEIKDKNIRDLLHKSRILLKYRK